MPRAVLLSATDDISTIPGAHINAAARSKGNDPGRVQLTGYSACARHILRQHGSEIAKGNKGLLCGRQSAARLTTTIR